MLSNRCLAEAQQISSECTNTESVYQAIKHTLERTIKLIRSRSIFQLMKQLRFNRIGTEDVENLVRRINEKFTRSRHRQLVCTVMDLKVQDARKSYEHERYLNTRAW